MSSKKSRSSGNKNTRKAVVQESVAPDWPAFKPLRAVEDLEVETIVESQIVVIRNFWTSTLCKNYVSYLKTLPLVTTPGAPKKGEALRVNDRFQCQSDVFANRLWVEAGLRELVCQIGGDVDDKPYTEGSISAASRELWGGDPIGLNPSIRIYRYSKGQYFDCHYDESNKVVIGDKPAKTTWTLLLYLTSPATGCKGGETVFYPDDQMQRDGISKDKIVVGLETGMLLLHKHGDECMLHEGREVTDGEKWVVRSDLCVPR